MVEHDPIVSSYFNKIPAMEVVEIRKIVTKFEEAKELALRSIAANKDALKYIRTICEDIIKQDRPISELVCDCEDSDEKQEQEAVGQPLIEGEKAPVKSVSMHLTRDIFVGQIEKLKKATKPEERYHIIYWLKFKTGVLIDILKKSGAEALAQGYLYARNKMIEANLRLVIYVAKKLQNKGIDMSDLIQEGNIGLIVAVDKYDYPPHNKMAGKACRFTTMAMFWIRLYAQRAVMTRSKTVRTPVYINNLMNKFHRAIHELSNTLLREPTAQEISDHLGWPIEKTYNVKEQVCQNAYIIHDSNSFDQDDCSSYINELPADGNMEEEVLGRMDERTLRQRIRNALGELTPRQEKVIRLRYGFAFEGEQEAEAERPRPHVAKILANSEGSPKPVSSVRMQDLEHKSMKKLKQVLAADFEFLSKYYTERFIPEPAAIESYQQAHLNFCQGLDVTGKIMSGDF